MEKLVINLDKSQTHREVVYPVSIRSEKDRGRYYAGARNYVWKSVKNGKRQIDPFCQRRGKKKDLCHYGVGV